MWFSDSQPTICEHLKLLLKEGLFTDLEEMNKELGKDCKSKYRCFLLFLTLWKRFFHEIKTIFSVVINTEKEMDKINCEYCVM